MIGSPFRLLVPALGALLLVGPTSALGLGGSRPAPGDEPGTLELVESVPVETELDLPDLRNTPDVWQEMLASARASVDISAFYFSERPDGPGALQPILQELEEAAGRGVRIRVLTDAGFYRTYPEVPDRLGSWPGAEMRLLDARALWGGSLHAKCFVVDGAQFFLGSQNWDWRALEHIHELGVRVRHEGLAAELQSIFELDWYLAGSAPTRPEGDSVEAAPRHRLRTAAGDTVQAVLAASPPHALPPGVPWDEPLLVELIDSAQKRLRLQLLSYAPVGRDGDYYEVLDNALRRAAARGVEVRIILADWSKRPDRVPHVQSLAIVPGVEIRFTTIPEWSGGFIPYARVEHPKYLVADGRACWIGTSNWARSYFQRGRNVSLFLYGASAAGDVERFFDGSWNSPYAEVVDPSARYEAPRFRE